jgi:hypothetical protein
MPGSMMHVAIPDDIVSLASGKTTKRQRQKVGAGCSLLKNEIFIDKRVIHSFIQSFIHSCVVCCFVNV